MISIDDAVQIIEQLIKKNNSLGEPIDHTVIVVGGTAMAAQGVRPFSHDVDLFIRTFSEDAVFQLENELKQTHGDKFRLDVTATENIWGVILIRDIEENSPVFKTIEVDGQSYHIRTLSVETLFLLKLSADRDKDRDDLPQLAPRTTPEQLIYRFNIVSKWHGNRQALLGYADEFIRVLESLYDITAKQIIEQLVLPKFIQEMLWETYYPSD